MIVPTYESSSKEQNLIISKLQQENQELKKQIEDLFSENSKLRKKLENSMTFQDYEYTLKKKVHLENQQKKFIEWLEDKLNMCDGFLDTIKSDLEEISYAGRTSGKTYIATQIMKNEIAKKCYEEVLSKYKEIIGDKDE